MKIQTKIAVLFASLTGGILLAVSFFIYYFTNQNTFQDFYKRLEIRAVVAAKAALGVEERDVQAYNEIREQHLETLPAEKEYIVRIGPDKIPVSGSLIRILPAGKVRQAITEGQSLWRSGNTFYYLLHYVRQDAEYLVCISALNELSIQYLNNLKRALVICFICATLLAFTIGLAFSKGILKPIRSITAKVRRLTVFNLHLRLDVKPGGDEISELSATFNSMLDRLETAFETQNNFVSHASHELNTPLTAIIGEAEFALAKPRTDAQYIESVTSIQAAAEKLSRITRSLLQLAQTGFTGTAQEMTRLRVDELLRDVRLMVDDIMPDNQVRLNHSLAPADIQQLAVRGNATLLELAIVNIVLNACKYSSNDLVHLAVAATRKHVLIIVKDNGIGIPKDEIRYVFDPFFRASNTGNFKGYGIGLPLTRNILRLHSGELKISSDEGSGTEIQISLPLA